MRKGTTSESKTQTIIWLKSRKDYQSDIFWKTQSGQKVAQHTQCQINLNHDDVVDQMINLITCRMDVSKELKSWPSAWQGGWKKGKSGGNYWQNFSGILFGRTIKNRTWHHYNNPLFLKSSKVDWNTNG